MSAGCVLVLEATPEDDAFAESTGGDGPAAAMACEVDIHGDVLGLGVVGSTL